MCYIGIDLGTSAMKLLLVDECGGIVNTVSKAYPAAHPRPGWSEQDPEDWWRAVSEGVPELLSAPGVDASQVRAIGCSGQMHGLVALDAQDNVIRPCILWNDSRTEEQVQYLNEKFGRARLSGVTGNIAFAGFTAPKLLWMREHEPRNFARIAKIMLPKDYIVYRLTGAFGTDFSDASGTLLLDVEHRCWSTEMIDICGLRATQLPTLHESFEAVGMVANDVSTVLGLSGRVPVAAGAGDNAAAAVGCGTVGDGACIISLGTSGTVFISSKRFHLDQANALHAFCHADGTYHLMGCILSAASCSGWFVGDILGVEDFDVEEAMIAPDPADIDLPYFLPYLMGERSPHNDATARAAFIGMSASTSRAELVRAVREGVAFAIRDCVEVARAQGIELDCSTLCGGGAKSAFMRQLMSDVLNMRLELPRTEQGPAYGSAILAAVACGDWTNVHERISDLARNRAIVDPRPEHVAAEERRYRIWRRLYPALKPIYQDV